MSASTPFEAARVPSTRVGRGVHPTVSVVVASNRDRALLRECLASLLLQCERLGAELIVARSGTPAEIESLQRVYPAVRFVAAPPGSGIPQLRGVGMAEAGGDIVALTEDHCVADPDWVETLRQSALDGVDIVGGQVANARGGAVDWAAYFAEYGFVARGARETTGAPELSGANVAYRRNVVAEVVEWARKGEWENVAHDRLRARGSVLRFIRTAEISQNETYRFLPFLFNRYRQGRDYARKRLAEERTTNRWLHLASAPLLPAVLTARVARAAAASRWRTFARALPATVAFLSAWSLGEAVGYLRGPLRGDADADPPSSDHT